MKKLMLILLFIGCINLVWHSNEKDIEVEDSVQDTENIDIEAFLMYDWTSDDVLVQGHYIEPEDSGRGWEFAIADIDFDGIQEMLISFPANHCGQNSLYIYKQDGGEVVSYADTIATFEKYIVSDIDYREISPYLDINLLAAYKNAKNEYKYLSLDYSNFGGDIHGSIGTVSLFETVLEEYAVPKKLLEISYSCPEEMKEMYFLGERIFENGELRDRLNDYMDGYIEVEIEYRVAEKSFSRDIVSMDEDIKKKELAELYGSLKDLMIEEQGVQ